MVVDDSDCDILNGTIEDSDAGNQSDGTEYHGIEEDVTDYMNDDESNLDEDRIDLNMEDEDCLDTGVENRLDTGDENCSGSEDVQPQNTVASEVNGEGANKTPEDRAGDEQARALEALKFARRNTTEFHPIFTGKKNLVL